MVPNFDLVHTRVQPIRPLSTRDRKSYGCEAILYANPTPIPKFKLVRAAACFCHVVFGMKSHQILLSFISKGQTFFSQKCFPQWRRRGRRYLYKILPSHLGEFYGRLSFKKENPTSKEAIHPLFMLTSAFALNQEGEKRPFSTTRLKSQQSPRFLGGGFCAPSYETHAYLYGLQWPTLVAKVSRLLSRGR